MPISKRDKDVSLTKVKKKTRETKENLVEQIRQAVDEYSTAYVFNIENMRSTHFIQIRQKFKHNSKFFFGKRNVMALALGRTEADEVAPGIHKMTESLTGQCGLVFTKEKQKDFINYFKTFHEEEFARAGNEATESVQLPAGPLPQFSFSMEPQLRKLGLPSKVEKGIVELYDDFTVCTVGETLNADQCKILKLLGTKMSNFKVNLCGQWTPKKGFVAL